MRVLFRRRLSSLPLCRTIEAFLVPCVGKHCIGFYMQQNVELNLRNCPADFLVGAVTYNPIQEKNPIKEKILGSDPRLK